MKKLAGLFAILASAYSLNANAFLTHCSINYGLNTVAFGIELGLGGKGNAVCEDITGNVINVPLNVQMVGGGFKFGSCTVNGHLETGVGIGFEWAELLSVIGKVEIGNMSNGGGSNGPAGKATFGVNGALLTSYSVYSGPCFGAIDGQILLVTQDLQAPRPVPYRARRALR